MTRWLEEEERDNRRGKQGAPARSAFLPTVHGDLRIRRGLTAPGRAHALSLEEIGTFESPTYVTSDLNQIIGVCPMDLLAALGPNLVDE